MWKQLVLVLVLVLAGTALGIAHTAYDLGYFWNDYLPSVARGDVPSDVPLLPEDQPQPKVAVDNEQHDFGRLERGRKGEHTFVFRNEGPGVLFLKAGDPPCKCTTPEVQKNILQPGESTEVRVGWTTDQEPGPFRKTIPIHTSDRKRLLVQLEIQGNIVQSYDVLPPTFEFGSVLYQQPRSAFVRLFGYGEKPLEVRKWELTVPANREYFDVEIEPQDKEKIDRAGATSAVLVRLNLKPGMLEGAIRQGLRLWISAAEEPLEVVARGQITSDVAVKGEGWDQQGRWLNFGTVSPREGARRTLILQLNGPGHDPSKFRVSRVDPVEMQVSLGQPQTAAGAKAVQLPLSIEIPPGTRPMNRLGSQQGPLGEIVLETDRTDGKPMSVFVRFAIQSQ
jgi:hypothetical protein